jgi:uncharacterized protein YkwD
MKQQRIICVVGVCFGLFGCGSSNEPNENLDETTAEIDAPGELQSGVPVALPAATTGNEKQFLIRVPEGATNLRFALAGAAGTAGNADLYVRYGSPAQTNAYNYRSIASGNNELVVPTRIRSGNWYVLVRARAAYTNVNLVASFTAATGSGGSAGTGGSSGGSSTGGASTGGSATGGSGGLNCNDPATWPADWVAFEDQVLQLVNARRAAGATCGGSAYPAVGPITMEAHLRVAARCHSLDMATQGYFDHTSLDGRSPWDRIAQAGYTRASWQGENIAAGYATPAAVVDGWMNSTGHCTNIMNAHFVDTGVGYAFLSSSPYRSYWTQDFAAH